MNSFLQKVYKQAAKNPKRIVFAEAYEDRTITAIEEILKRKIAMPILIGNSTQIKNNAKKLKLKIDWEKTKIVNPKNSKLKDHYAKLFYEARKDKGVSLKQATSTMENIYYFGTMMVENNDADGMVSGLDCHTKDSVLPAFQIIKTKEKFHKVSGIFFMILEKKVLLFSDCSINVEPNSHDLADIACDTAETAKRFGLQPRVAFLSFSTKGSNEHPLIDKVREAVAITKARDPKLIIDGELQVDAALVPEVAARKAPKSTIQGNANVLIFPSLETGNIAYKLVERLARAKAIGPLLQGLRKPVNDLSRGCSVKDIVDVTAFTVCECQELPLIDKIKK